MFGATFGRAGVRHRWKHIVWLSLQRRTVGQRKSIQPAREKLVRIKHPSAQCPIVPIKRHRRFQKQAPSSERLSTVMLISYYFSIGRKNYLAQFLSIFLLESTANGFQCVVVRGEMEGWKLHNLYHDQKGSLRTATWYLHTLYDVFTSSIARWALTWD